MGATTKPRRLRPRALLATASPWLVLAALSVDFVLENGPDRNLANCWIVLAPSTLLVLALVGALRPAIRALTHGLPRSVGRAARIAVFALPWLLPVALHWTMRNAVSEPVRVLALPAFSHLLVGLGVLAWPAVPRRHAARLALVALGAALALDATLVADSSWFDFDALGILDGFAPDAERTADSAHELDPVRGALLAAAGAWAALALAVRHVASVGVARHGSPRGPHAWQLAPWALVLVTLGRAGTLALEGRVATLVVEAAWPEPSGLDLTAIEALATRANVLGAATLAPGLALLALTLAAARGGLRTASATRLALPALVPTLAIAILTTSQAFAPRRNRSFHTQDALPLWELLTPDAPPFEPLVAGPLARDGTYLGRPRITSAVLAEDGSAVLLDGDAHVAHVAHRAASDTRSFAARSLVVLPDRRATLAQLAALVDAFPNLAELAVVAQHYDPAAAPTAQARLRFVETSIREENTLLAVSFADDEAALVGTTEDVLARALGAAPSDTFEAIASPPRPRADATVRRAVRAASTGATPTSTLTHVEPLPDEERLRSSEPEGTWLLAALGAACAVFAVAFTTPTSRLAHALDLADHAPPPRTPAGPFRTAEARPTRPPPTPRARLVAMAAPTARELALALVLVLLAPIVVGPSLDTSTSDPLLHRLER